MTDRDPKAMPEAKIHFLDYWRVVRLRLPIIVLTFLLVVITAGITTYFLPRQYESNVIIEVEQNDQKIRIFRDGFDGAMGLDPRFATTQFQIIQRKEMLYPVIDNLKLVEKWAESAGVRTREEAYFKLRSMIDVREVRNTNLLQISVESTDPKEAADLANSIANEYQRKRIDEQQKMLNRSLATLEDEVAKQRKRVEESNSEMSRIRSELSITDLNPDSMEDPMQAQEKVLMDQESLVNEARVKAGTLRTKYDEIEKLSGDDLMRALQTLEIQDQTVAQILPQYQETDSELARALQSGLGPRHPNIQSLAAKKATYERQLSDQVASIRRTLAANLEITERSLATMETQLEKSRGQQRDSRNRSSEYASAKNAHIQAKKILESAELRLSTETMQRSMPMSPARIWERAEPASYPSKPKVWLNMALAVVVGLIVGIGLAFFLEYLDTSVKTMEDVESFLQVPVLAVVPQNIHLLVQTPEATADAEAYRILRTNVEFNRKTSDANTVTFVSGGAGEGKSTTLANLAFTFAQGGYNTLIVDADLRRPSQHRAFGVENERGLTDFLTSDIDLEDVVQTTSIPGLFLLTSGHLPSDAVGVLNSQRMMDLIAQVKNRFDIVFFDSPPILGVSDASVLVRALDLTIVVVQHRRFPRAMLQRVKQAVENAGGNILGVVLNNVDVRHDQYYEYYTNYYHYYYPKPGEEAASAGKKTPAKNSRRQSAHVPEDEY
ncbi:MAG: polysaccharide biosynthesis tyrosine autokinase [Chthoniobacterales bacterium]|nr:polysaccharide biosynthesis tyrosine autokinase [Chthoniobacterales bacterium]